MLLNIVVILFILAMAYWWSAQGLFSAMLHLVMVIVAGTLALAIWEPMVVLIMGLPEFITENLRFYVWGIGLLLPFLAILALLRTLSDRLVRGNVHVHGIVSQIGGGAFGVASAVLTAGLTIIALNFLGGAPPVGGYEPYSISRATGEVEPNPDRGNLLLKVDSWTSGFFNHLSRAGFGDGLGHRTPLATYRPELAKQAAIFTMRYDPHAIIVADPEGVELNEVYTFPTNRLEELSDMPEGIRHALGSELNSSDHRIIVVDSDWYQRGGTYDLDGTLRVPPTQVRLLAHHEDRGGNVTAHLHAPRAFSRVTNPQSGERNFIPLDGEVYASSTSSEQRLGWIFVVPYEHKPVAAFLRQLRLPIERTLESADDLQAALGGPPAIEDDEERQREAERRRTDDADDIEELRLTNSLPRAISRNEATRLRYQQDDDEYHVVSGKDEVSRSPHGLSRRIRVNSVYEPSHLVTVRLRVRGDRARSLFGRAVQLARQLQGVSLLDDTGGVHWPVGYAWEKAGDAMELNFPRGETIRSASQLPINQMGDDHALYLYFQIGRDQNVTITGYQVGEESRSGLNVRIPSN